MARNWRRLGGGETAARFVVAAFEGGAGLGGDGGAWGGFRWRSIFWRDAKRGHAGRVRSFLLGLGEQVGEGFAFVGNRKRALAG
jgi:hypothetical protein